MINNSMTLPSWIPSNNRFERIWILAQVDFKKRYYNDKLGLLWALLNPAFKIAVYYFVFKIIFGAREENYALFLFSGIIFWTTFAEVTKRGLSIFKSKKYLIENIQFKTEDLFISHSISVFFGFLFNLAAYFAISLAVGIPLYSTILYLPILVLNLFIISFAVSLILAIIQLFIKDIVHLWDVLLMVGFWTSGIFFSAEVFFKDHNWVFILNPFVGIIMHLRDFLIDGYQPTWWILITNLVYGLVLLMISLWFFKKYSHYAIEKT